VPRQEEVLKNVRAAFERKPCINLHRYPVHMAFHDGILTLDSEVEPIVAKKLGLELATAVPGVDGLMERGQAYRSRLERGFLPALSILDRSHRARCLVRSQLLTYV
jgi:hypothetical protein